MNPDIQELIAEAFQLLNAHEASKQACLDFLKARGESGYDPVSLKLWVIDAQMKLAREAQAIACN